MLNEKQNSMNETNHAITLQATSKFAVSTNTLKFLLKHYYLESNSVVPSTQFTTGKGMLRMAIVKV